MRPEEIKELIALRAERDAKDALKNYVPGPTQAACEKCPAMVRMLQGANRTGKTAHMLAEISKAARRLHPTRTTNKPVIYVIWAKSREQIRDVLYQKMRVRSEFKGKWENEPMIPDSEVIKDHMVSGAGKPVCREIELKNNNRILFAISGVDKSWEALQGKGRIAGIGVDEQAGTQKLIDECMARLMELNNPSDVAEFGGAWFMWASSETLISDAWDNLKSICLDPDRNKDAKYFHIKAEENFAVTAEARERVGQFMSEEARKIRITGDGNARAATLVYGKQFSDERHMLKNDHIPSERSNLWVGYDPGVDHPTGFGVFCIEPDYPTQLIGVKFWNYRGETIERDVKNLAEWFRDRRMAGFVYDTNLKNKDRGGGPSVLEQMKDLMDKAGIAPIGGYWQARKQVAAGIAIVRHYLDPVPDNRSVTPLVLFNQSDDSGGKIMRWQMLKYAGHEEKQFTGAGSIIKKDDELVDILRYTLMQRPSWNKDLQCGLSTTSYEYKASLEQKQVESVEILTPEQAYMARLMDMSRLSASLRGRRGSAGRYVSL